MKIGIAGLQPHQIHNVRLDNPRLDLEFMDLDKGMTVDKIQSFARKVEKLVVMTKVIPRTRCRDIPTMKVSYCDGSVGSLSKLLQKLMPAEAKQKAVVKKPLTAPVTPVVKSSVPTPPKLDKVVIANPVETPSTAPKWVKSIPATPSIHGYKWKDERAFVDVFENGNSNLDIFDIMNQGDVARLRRPNNVEMNMWLNRLHSNRTLLRTRGLEVYIFIYEQFADFYIQEEFPERFAKRGKGMGIVAPDGITRKPKSSEAESQVTAEVAQDTGGEPEVVETTVSVTPAEEETPATTTESIDQTRKVTVHLGHADNPLKGHPESRQLWTIVMLNKLNEGLPLVDACSLADGALKEFNERFLPEE